MSKQQRPAYVPHVGDHVKTVSGCYGDVVEVWKTQSLAPWIIITKDDGAVYHAAASAIIAVIPNGSDQQFVVVRKAGHMSLLPRGTKWAEDQLSLYNRNKIK